MANSRTYTAGIWLNGIPVLQPLPDVYDVINSHFQFNDSIFFTEDYQRRILFPYPYSQARPPLKINRLYVPSGAQRFAIGHFCVDKTRLQQILLSSPSGSGSGSYYGSGSGGPHEVLLEMGDPDDAAHYKTFALYMLPPIPLTLDIDWAAAKTAYPATQKSGNNGTTVFIITLVDQRYFWQNDYYSTPSSGPQTLGCPGSGSGSGSGSSGCCPGVDDAFTPDYGDVTDSGDTGYIGDYISGGSVSGFASYYRNPFTLAEYEDLRIMNQGRMLAAMCPSSFLGGYEAVSHELSLERLDEDRVVFAKDLLANANIDENELARFVPQTFVAYFQHFVDGVAQRSYHRVAVDVSDSSAGISSGYGYEGEGIFLSWVRADMPQNFTAGDCPFNRDDLETAAQELALQYYKSCLCDAFETYAGICNFQNNGLFDYIIYEAIAGQGDQINQAHVRTAIRRMQFSNNWGTAQIDTGGVSADASSGSTFPETLVVKLQSMVPIKTTAIGDIYYADHYSVDTALYEWVNNGSNLVLSENGNIDDIKRYIGRYVGYDDIYSLPVYFVEDDCCASSGSGSGSGSLPECTDLCYCFGVPFGDYSPRQWRFSISGVTNDGNCMDCSAVNGEYTLTFIGTNPVERSCGWQSDPVPGFTCGDGLPERPWVLGCSQISCDCFFLVLGKSNPSPGDPITYNFYGLAEDWDNYGPNVMIRRPANPGNYACDTPTFLVIEPVVNECSGGGGFGVESDCCPSPGIPPTLCAAVTSKTGNCSLMDDYFNLTYDQTSTSDKYWVGDTNSSGNSLQLACVSGSNDCADLTLANASIGNGTLISCTCDPFELVYSFTADAAGPYHPGTATITITQNPNCPNGGGGGGGDPDCITFCSFQVRKTLKFDLVALTGPCFGFDVLDQAISYQDAFGYYITEFFTASGGTGSLQLNCSGGSTWQFRLLLAYTGGSGFYDSGWVNFTSQVASPFSLQGSVTASANACSPGIGTSNITLSVYQDTEC